MPIRTINPGEYMTMNIPEGYVRFATKRRGKKYEVVAFVSNAHANPGVGVTLPAGETLVPALGIVITNPASADAWADVFTKTANKMRKEAEGQKDG